MGSNGSAISTKERMDAGKPTEQRVDLKEKNETKRNKRNLYTPQPTSLASKVKKYVHLGKLFFSSSFSYYFNANCDLWKKTKQNKERSHHRGAARQRVLMRSLFSDCPR